MSLGAGAPSERGRGFYWKFVEFGRLFMGFRARFEKFVPRWGRSRLSRPSNGYIYMCWPIASSTLSH